MEQDSRPLFGPRDSPSGPFARLNPLIELARQELREANKGGRKSLRLRVAAYLAVDYVKCLLSEFATELDLPTNQAWSVPQRYREILIKVPELARFAEFVDNVDELRNFVVKHDEKLPDPKVVGKVVRGAFGFRRFLDVELRSRERGNSPSDTIEEVLERCEGEIVALRRIDEGMTELLAERYRLRQVSLRQLLRSLEAEDGPSAESLLNLTQIELARIVQAQQDIKAALEELDRIEEYVERENP